MFGVASCIFHLVLLSRLCAVCVCREQGSIPQVVQVVQVVPVQFLCCGLVRVAFEDETLPNENAAHGISFRGI